MKAEKECRWALEIPEFLQGRLDPGKQAQLEAHLRQCPACAATVAEFKTVLAQLAAPAPAQAAQDLAPEILARIPPRAWRPAPRLSFPRLLLKVAAILVIMLAGWQLAIRNTPGPATLATAQTAAERLFLQNARDWLFRTQEPGGHWDAAKCGAQKQYTVGITALALMAALKTTPGQLADTPAAEVVARGLNYLLQQQQADGRLGPFGSSTPYNHSLGTLALLEAYARDARPNWRDAIEKALAYIQSTQRDSGAWGYPREAADKGNTSITAWQVLALQRAAQLGWDQAQAPVNRALAWLHGVADETGRVGYSRPRDFPYGFETLTAAGALCLMGKPSSSSAEVLARIMRNVQAAAGQTDLRDYYRAYFIASALQADGSARSIRLRQDLQQPLLASQTRAGPHQGSCEPTDRWSAAGGRVYTTAMAMLSMDP